jgi:hypothetical protein
MLESADESEIVILETTRGILKTIVEEGVGASILHERLEASTDSN